MTTSTTRSTRRAAPLTTNVFATTTTAFFAIIAAFHVSNAGVEAWSDRPGSCNAKIGHGASVSDGASAGYSLTKTSGTGVTGEQVTLTLAAPAGGAKDFRGFVVTADDGVLAAVDSLTSRAASNCLGAASRSSAKPRVSGSPISSTIRVTTS